jgi:hypothetical protein
VAAVSERGPFDPDPDPLEQPLTSALAVETLAFRDTVVSGGRCFMEVKPPPGYALFGWHAFAAPDGRTMVAFTWARMR